MHTCIDVYTWTFVGFVLYIHTHMCMLIIYMQFRSPKLVGCICLHTYTYIHTYAHADADYIHAILQPEAGGMQVDDDGPRSCASVLVSGIPEGQWLYTCVRVFYVDVCVCVCVCAMPRFWFQVYQKVSGCSHMCVCVCYVDMYLRVCCVDVHVYGCLVSGIPEGQWLYTCVCVCVVSIFMCVYYVDVHVCGCLASGIP
jgi:hypothetical protein